MARYQSERLLAEGKGDLFDVRVCYPIAPKKRCYGEKVWEVERASFTPLVFSSTEGMASKCTT